MNAIVLLLALPAALAAAPETEVGIGLDLGLGFGDIRPLGPSYYDPALDLAVMPATGLTVGLRRGWWLNPSLVVSAQPVEAMIIEGESDSYEDVRRWVVRLGVEFQETVRIETGGTWTPTVSVRGGSWGGSIVRTSQSHSDYSTAYRNAPLAGPWALGGALGLSHELPWQGRWFLDLSLRGSALVGGPLAPGWQGWAGATLERRF